MAKTTGTNGWRFYPLAEYPDEGILRCEANGRVRCAAFLTPEQAKSLQAKKQKAA